MNDHPSFVETLGQDLRAGRSRWLRRKKRALWSSAAVVLVAGLAVSVTTLRDQPEAQTVETASLPTSPAPSNLESLIPLLPEPTDIEISPSSNPEDQFSIEPNGVAVLRIHGTGWSDTGGSLWICEDAQAPGSHELSCSAGRGGPVSASIDSGANFTVDMVVTPDHDGNEIRFSSTDGTEPQIVGRIAVPQPPYTFGQGSDLWMGAASIDRSSRQLSAFGAGWVPDSPLAIFICDEGPFPGAPVLNRCYETERITPDSTGAINLTLQLPRFPPDTNSNEFGPGDQLAESFAIVAVQAHQAAALTTTIWPPALSVDYLWEAPDDTHIRVEVFDLIDGEIGEIRWCTNYECDNSEQIATIEGDQTSRVSTILEVPPEARYLTLWLNGASTSGSTRVRDSNGEHPPAEVSGEPDEQSGAPSIIGDPPVEASPDPGLPPTWLGVTNFSTIRLFRTNTDDELREFGTIETTEPTHEGAVSQYFTHAWPIGGSDDVYGFTCCDQPSGSGLLLTPMTGFEGGRPAIVGFGAVPSPDGSQIAIPQQLGLRIADSAPFSRGWFVSETPVSSRSTVTWLRNTNGLVWGPIREAGVSVDLTQTVFEYVPNNGDVTENQKFTVSGVAAYSLAADSNGNVLIAGCTKPEEDCTEYSLLTVDPRTGIELARVPIEQYAQLGGTDPTGQYLIYSTGSSTVRWRGPNGTSGILATGISWATWGD